MFILDTDVLSEMGRSNPHPRLINWIRDQPSHELATTVVTIWEINAGIERIRPQHPDKAGMLAAWINRIVENGTPQIFGFGVDEGVLYGRMREVGCLRNFIMPDPRRKWSKSSGDLMISAIAICRQACIVTRNVSDYLAIHRHFALPGIYDPVARISHEDGRIEVGSRTAEVGSLQPAM